MLVFFGYTNCPDECPLTLVKIAIALYALGPLADTRALLFIAVNSARNAPNRPMDSLTNFDAGNVGLTGSEEQIAAAGKAFRVHHAPLNTNGPASISSTIRSFGT